MKSKIAFAALFAALLVSCSPEVYRVNLDVRKPSSSGFNLLGKSVGIVYEEGPTGVDSLFSAETASAFAKELEKDYFGGEEVIGLYTIPVQDSVTVSTMRDLVMDTEEDVIFVMTSRSDSLNPAGHIPYRMQLYVYDSMGKDELKTYNGKTTLPNTAQATADVVAKKISGRFLSKWETQTFPLYWFDDFNSEEWLTAILNISEGNFDDAIEIWEDFVKSKNKQKAACAAYNLGMGYYLLGQKDLALRWLDMAEKLENVPLAASLRRKIVSDLEK